MVGFTSRRDASGRERHFKIEIKHGELTRTEFASEEEALNAQIKEAFEEERVNSPDENESVFLASLVDRNPLAPFERQSVDIDDISYPLPLFLHATNRVFYSLKKLLEQNLGEKIDESETRHLILRALFGSRELGVAVLPEENRAFIKQKGNIMPRELDAQNIPILWQDNLVPFVLRSLWGKERVSMRRPKPTTEENLVFAKKYLCSQEVLDRISFLVAPDYGSCFSYSVELFFKKKPGLSNKELAKLMKLSPSRISQIVNSRNFRRMEALIPITDDPQNPARYYNCVKACVPYASKEPFFLDFAVSDFVFNTVFPQENPCSNLADILKGFDAKTVFDEYIREKKV